MLESHTYGCDLVEQVGKLDGPIVVGRGDEITSIISILYRQTNNNPLLIGEPGVGKTSIVKGLVQRIVSGDVPHNNNLNLNGVRVIALDMPALVVGAKYKGEQVGEILKRVLEKVEKAPGKGKGKVILFIDEIHLLFEVGAAALLLKPLIERGRLQCIGATSPKEFSKYVQQDSSFESCFECVFVGESSVCDTINILRGLKEKYEVFHGVRILDSAVVAAVQLSSLHITGFLPDKAIDLIDETCAEVRLQADTQPREIDNLQRKRMELELEFHALKKEKDIASNARVAEVTKELANLKDELHPLMMKYKREKEKQKEVLVTLQDVEKMCDVVRVANMKFGEIMHL